MTRQRHYLLLLAGIICIGMSVCLATYAYVIQPIIAEITKPRPQPTTIIATGAKPVPSPRVKVTPSPKPTATPKASPSPSPTPQPSVQPSAQPTAEPTPVIRQPEFDMGEVATIPYQPSRQRQLSSYECTNLIRLKEQVWDTSIPPECDWRYQDHLRRREAVETQRERTEIARRQREDEERRRIEERRRQERMRATNAMVYGLGRIITGRRRY